MVHQARLLFLHLPKTAGISLKTTIFAQFPTEVIFEIEPAAPVESILHLKSLSSEQLDRLHVITGHTIWGVHRFVPSPFLYVTMLRDPVERVISLYSYMNSSPTHYLHQDMKSEQIDFEKFLDWEKSFSHVDNQQTKLLAGVFDTDIACTKQIYEQAKRHLIEYCLVGLTERYSDSLHIYSDVFGWHNKSNELSETDEPNELIVRANVTPERLQQSDIGKNALDRLRHINQFDLALYELAEQLFEEQLRMSDKILQNKRMTLSHEDEKDIYDDFDLI